MAEHKELQRVVRVPGAVLLGLGSIMGTGVYVSIGIAATEAGSYVLLAVIVAAVVATANGLSSAQLAASHPVSGGTYSYGYRYLHPVAGFSAGWLFLCAKSASAATAALGFAGYLIRLLDLDDSDGLLLSGIAVGAVVLVTAFVLAGVRRSNHMNLVLIVITLVGLIAFMVGAFGASNGEQASNAVTDATTKSFEFQPFFYACALMFVAYTGYGRIATLGEEAIEPRRTIPRAMIATLVVSALVYIAVAWALVNLGGPESLSDASRAERAAPLEFLLHLHGAHTLATVVSVGAMVAMLGVLLNLVLGLSRVWLAMGRQKDMPPQLAHISEGKATPVAAVILTSLVVLGIALVGDVKTAWSFSAFTVLIYYAMTNACALRLAPEDRRFPRWISWLGLLLCLGLARFVDWHIALLGVGLVALGLMWRVVARKVWGAPRS